MQRKVHHYSIRPEEQMPVDICNKKHQNDIKKGKVLQIFYCRFFTYMNVFKENTAHHSKRWQNNKNTGKKGDFVFTRNIYMPQYYRAACDLM